MNEHTNRMQRGAPRRRTPSAWLARLSLALLVVGAAAPASALPVLLSEVFYDASGSDDGLLFVELQAAPGTVLDGYTIEGVNGSNGAVGPVVTLSGVVGASRLFVVADARTDGTSDVAGADLYANFDFQNGPDSVVLRDDLGTVLDALGYGVFGAGEINAGEGMPAPDPAAGSSLARVFADMDTNDNLADFEVLAMPTPGVAAFANVPEPGTALMLGAGLVGLGVTGRRR